MPELAARVKQIGLTQVYCSKEKPLVDIVLVHGLNGHPYNTWATQGNPPVFWPADLLPEVLESSRVRILTYGYNANVASFTDGASRDRIHHHAETLASGLAANRNVSDATCYIQCTISFPLFYIYFVFTLASLWLYFGFILVSLYLYFTTTGLL